MLIKEIPNEERPRERLIKYGVGSLSNEELLSIILSTGYKSRSCKEVSIDILKYFESITNMKNASINNLSKIKGVGVSKACNILASIELGKRVFNDNSNSTKILSTEDVYNYIKGDIEGNKQEHFYAIYLDNKNKVLEKRLLFIGTINKSVVHPREVFKYAYLSSATSIIVVHNHPSGEVSPSKEDIEITKALVELGNINKIPIIDHVIVGASNYYSFNEELML